MSQCSIGGDEEEEAMTMIDKNDNHVDHLQNHASNQADSTPNSELTNQGGGEEERDLLRIDIDRPVYTQEEFDQDCRPLYEKEKTWKENVREFASRQKSKCTCSGTYVKNVCLSKFPFIGIMRQYSLKSDLIEDVVAGITVGIIQIPMCK